MIVLLLFLFSSLQAKEAARLGEPRFLQENYKKSQFTSDESQDTADLRKVLLATGEDRVIDLNLGDKDIIRNGISIGDEGKVEARLIRIDGKATQLLLKPKAAGSTNITIRDQKGDIQLVMEVEVGASDLLKIAGEIRELTKDIEGLDIKIVGKNIVVDGEVIVPDDYGRLVNVLSSSDYGSNVLNLVTLSKISLNALSKRIEQDVRPFAPSVKTRVVNGSVWLEGVVESVGQANQAVRVAELYLPELKPPEPLRKYEKDVQIMPGRPLVQNFIIIQPRQTRKQEEKMIRLTVHFVELAKDYLRLFGFKWQPGFTADPQISIGQNLGGQVGAAQTGAGQQGVSFAATLSSLFPKLQSAQNAGYARVLKEATVLGRDRQPASLVDETVIPFVVQGPNGQVATETAQVGLSLGMTATVLGNTDDIRLDIELTQTNLAGRAGNAPITARHQVKTNLLMKANESAAIAGVKSTDVQTNFNKDDPGAGDFGQGPQGAQTESLFNLLRSKSFSKKKGQYVMFITPQLIQNASDGTGDLKKNFRIRVN